MFSKEALEFLTHLRTEPKDHIVEVGDNIFQVDNDGDALQIFIENDRKAKKPLILHNLTSLISYIKKPSAKSDLNAHHRGNSEFYLHIENPATVTLVGAIDQYGDREELVRVKGRVPEFKFDQYYDSEQFLIALKSRFTNDFDRDALIAFAGNVKEENARQTSDDGFSQKTTVKRGIASSAEELVPGSVTLTPYRTFTEINQVASEFVFRMAEGPQFALFEADGGSWINKTVHRIGNYLSEGLKEEIESGKITILS